MTHTNTNFKILREETELAGWNVHNHLKDKSLEELQEIVARDRHPFSVMCLNITGSLNTGNIIRTSHAFGAEQVFVVGRKCFDGRSMVGSNKYFPVHKVDAIKEDCTIDLDIVNNVFEDNKLCPIFVETGGRDYRKFNWNKMHDCASDFGHNLCLVMGNEGIGIPQELMVNSVIVSIPQRGCIRSINVSSAFSIVCSHMVNQVWD